MAWYDIDMKKGNYKHGGFGTPTYKSWAGLLYRCRTNGKYWKEKGITVCKRWLKFENFLVDMGEKPNRSSIDRIDNKKGYYKGNCQWATSKQQAINRSTTRLFKFNGQKNTLTDWSKILGIKRSTLAQRYYVYGWSVNRTLSEK